VINVTPKSCLLDSRGTQPTDIFCSLFIYFKEKFSIFRKIHEVNPSLFIFCHGHGHRKTVYFVPSKFISKTASQSQPEQLPRRRDSRLTIGIGQQIDRPSFAIQETSVFQDRLNRQSKGA
jgi:hypothetical protein